MNDASFRRVLDRGDVIKICGLREPAHAAAAAAAGADLIGFIFAPARRQVTVETARACILAARKAAATKRIIAVGVFVDAGPDEISAVVREAELDAIQLHGQESPTIVQELPAPAIKVIKPRPEESEIEVLREIDRYQAQPVAPSMFMIEGYSPHGAGGTGTRVNWGLAAALAGRHPLLLSGGLDPDNVHRAITEVRPAGVDVSSGVEIDGVKSTDSINRFVHAARQAFATQATRK